MDGTFVNSKNSPLKYLKWDEFIFFPHQREGLKKEIQKLKEQGKKIVFTNGCFDLLHEWHLKNFEICCELAGENGVTFVAFNGDDSPFFQTKSGARPYNNEVARARMLAKNRDIDYIIPFEEVTALTVMQIINPDIYVKWGKDYIPEFSDWDPVPGSKVLENGSIEITDCYHFMIKNGLEKYENKIKWWLPEAPFVIQNGGRVILTPNIEGFSTTFLIEKIREDNTFTYE